MSSRTVSARLPPDTGRWGLEGSGREPHGRTKADVEARRWAVRARGQEAHVAGRTPQEGGCRWGSRGPGPPCHPLGSNAGLPPHTLAWPPLGDLGPEATRVVSAPAWLRQRGSEPRSLVPPTCSSAPRGFACCSPRGWGPNLALWTRDMGTSCVWLGLVGRGTVRSCGACLCLLQDHRAECHAVPASRQVPPPPQLLT